MGLQNLKIEGCDTLEFIPEKVMDRISSLQHFYIINCCSLKSFRGHSLASLKSIYIQNCRGFKFFPPIEKTDRYEELEYFCIGNSCDFLISLPLSFFPNLRTLSIWDCANLESLSMPEEIQESPTSLEALGSGIVLS